MNTITICNAQAFLRLVWFDSEGATWDSPVEGSSFEPAWTASWRTAEMARDFGRLCPNARQPARQRMTLLFDIEIYLTEGCHSWRCAF